MSHHPPGQADTRINNQPAESDRDRAVVEIDVAICTFNNSAELDRTLTCLAEQTIRRISPADFGDSSAVRWRVLVVDNNSTDDTHAVVARHIKSGRLPELEWVFEPKQGLHHARRRALLSTRAPWIAFVDDDCTLAPDWIEQAAAFIHAHPDCGGFGGRIVLDWQSSRPAFTRAFGYCWAEQDRGQAECQVESLPGAGLIVRHAAVAQVGWLDDAFLPDRTGHKLVSGGDVELTLRLSAKFELWYHPRCQLRHRIPPRRARFRYLWRLVHGLGRSQQHADAMLWTPDQGRWWASGARGAARHTRWAVGQMAGSMLGKRPLREGLLQISFAAGRWAGLCSQLCMRSTVRRALLGRAAKGAA